MEDIEVDKLLILALFNVDIYGREDLKNPEKLLRLKDNLEQNGCLASPSVDQDSTPESWLLSMKNVYKTPPQISRLGTIRNNIVEQGYLRSNRLMKMVSKYLNRKVRYTLQPEETEKKELSVEYYAGLTKQAPV
jgi:hypothetical protein